MENLLSRADQKLTMIMKHAPMGVAEIDKSGDITSLNLKGETLIKPILIANNLDGNNLFAILNCIAPSIVDKIKNSRNEAGNIITNELHCFTLSFGEENVERHFSFNVTKIFSDCTIVGFDDITESRLKEKAIMELIADKAVAQGKYEIASNVLHDIGNAVVGFGSYLNRIKRSLEHNYPVNLQKLTGFFTAQQPVLTTVIGEVKASAVVNMLSGITDSQKKNQEEINKSVKEQFNIINHIQEILNIQRQYLNGHSTLERRPTNLCAIINDCMSMLYASIEKRAISVSINIPEKLPDMRADRTKLMQVILNILKNSIEAIDVNAEEKHISITVKVNNDFIKVQVQDTGHGFDAETGKKLFVRGFTTKAAGTGLGLNNCRIIIESHEGTIGITSDGFGKGALTTIEFKI
jgi:signal transduction histidine kinase